MPETISTDDRNKSQDKVWAKAWRDYRANLFTGRPSKARGKARRRKANGR